MPASSIVSDIAAMEGAFRPPAFRHDAAAVPAHHKLLPPPPPPPPSPHGVKPRTPGHVLTGDWASYTNDTSTGEFLLVYSIEEAPGGSFTVRKKFSGYVGTGHLSATHNGPPDAPQMISINISSKIEEHGWLNAAHDRITWSNWSYGEVWAWQGTTVCVDACLADTNDTVRPENRGRHQEVCLNACKPRGRNSSLLD